MRHRNGKRRAWSFVTVMVLLTARPAVVGVAPASAAPAWTVASSANPAGPPTGRFTADACAGATSCFAVGACQVGSSGSATYIQHWNGTGWAIAASPNPAGATVSELDGVACPDSATCFAVGFSNAGPGGSARPLVEAWNGRAGRSSPHPRRPARLCRAFGGHVCQCDRLLRRGHVRGSAGATHRALGRHRVDDHPEPDVPRARR